MKDRATPVPFVTKQSQSSLKIQDLKPKNRSQQAGETESVPRTTSDLEMSSSYSMTMEVEPSTLKKSLGTRRNWSRQNKSVRS